MARKVQRGILTLLIAGTLSACGANSENPEDSESSSLTKGKGGERFSLATFLHTEPKVSKLAGNVAAGDAYVFFGPVNRFRVETNMTLVAASDPGYFTGTHGVSASYWLDGFVFKNKLGGATKGFLVDVGVSGNLDPISTEAYVRFYGKDKYRGKMEAAINMSFARDLNLNTVLYPAPLLGVKVGGNIGGELGFGASVGARKNGTLGILFRPRAYLNGGLAAGLELLKFTSAEIVGTVVLVGIDVASSLNVGFMPESKFAYGSIGIDGAQLIALDGKVEIVAKAGLTSILPGGIDAGLWQAVGDVVGIPGMEWRHTIWDPTTLYRGEFPSNSRSYLRFSAQFADCSASRKESQKQLDTQVALLKKQSTAAPVGLDRQVLNTTVKNFLEIKTRLLSYCK